MGMGLGGFGANPFMSFANERLRLSNSLGFPGLGNGAVPGLGPLSPTYAGPDPHSIHLLQQAALERAAHTASQRRSSKSNAPNEKRNSSSG